MISPYVRDSWLWRHLMGLGDDMGWRVVDEEVQEEEEEPSVKKRKSAQRVVVLEVQKEEEEPSVKKEKLEKGGEVGLEKAHPYTKYKVTKFLYATSEIHVPESFLLFPFSREGWTKESNWMGYVAVTDDQGTALLGRRDIVIAWRGSVQPLWVNDFAFGLVNGKKKFGEKNDQIQIHQSWYSIYMSENERSPFNKANARDQVLRELGRLLEKYKEEEVSISICGHSLGAALATLNATDIVANGYNRPKSRPDKSCPVTAFVFACPRVGDSDFKKLFSGLQDLRVLRIRNLPDVVPIYPPIGYAEVGDELPIDTRKSQYMKSPGNFATFHCLEAYLHGVAGTQGIAKADLFRLDVKRDIGLVNKSVDGLKDECMVPGHWRALKNKGMVQQDDGSWKFWIMRVMTMKIMIYEFLVIFSLSSVGC
ncbi:unnamed protein product [Microthlaspi erraticum]|uniref:Phospholipase A1 n=1 Tax=Microthlaspi erraticum TaxID=1685480 RepID=A0A6D2JLS8_9BRAS|nr:unnamed protein product [Microthlaspi erraticum]